MHRWHVGQLEVIRIEDDDFAVPASAPVPAWCVPELAPSDREVGIAFSALAVRSADTRVVIDPWLANDHVRGADDAVARSTRLLDQLTAAGFAPDEVDVVVLTHVDGVGWTTRPDADGQWHLAFPNARHLVPRRVIDDIDAGVERHGAEGLAVLRDLIELDRVDPPTAIAPGLGLIDLPGHDDGHAGVRLDDDGDVAIYAGHLFLTPLSIADPEVGPDGDQLAVAAATRRQVLDELADGGGLLLTTLLGGPGSGRVQRDGDGFRLDL